jgi:hypothetical protein
VRCDVLPHWTGNIISLLRTRNKEFWWGNFIGPIPWKIRKSISVFWIIMPCSLEEARHMVEYIASVFRMER